MNERKDKIKMSYIEDYIQRSKRIIFFTFFIHSIIIAIIYTMNINISICMPIITCILLTIIYKLRYKLIESLNAYYTLSLLSDDDNKLNPSYIQYVTDKLSYSIRLKILYICCIVTSFLLAFFKTDGAIACIFSMNILILINLLDKII